MSVRAPTRYLWLINGYINIHMVFILLPLVEKGNAHSKKKNITYTNSIKIMNPPQHIMNVCHQSITNHLAPKKLLLCNLKCDD